MATDYDDLVLPVLLAEARRAFTTAIRADLSAAGFDDMPAAGARVIGRIAHGGTSVSEVAMAYGVTKQAGSQLVDALVLRGYVERVPDPVDRRRMNVALTARGEEAATVLRGAIERVEAALLEVIDGQTLVTMRAGLGVLAAIGFGESPPRPEVPAAAAERALAHGGALVQPMEGEAPEIAARIADPAGNVIGVAQQ